MILTYFIVSAVLMFIWLCCVVGVTWQVFFLEEEDLDFFKQASAILAGVFLAIVIWPAVIPLALVIFILYGLTQGMKFLFKRGAA